jgi:lipoyl-dependent peroxiredoxin
MNMADSRATAQWSGSLFEGKGSVTPESGSFGELPLTWADRTDRPKGSTSPEELIASAHASCFSMQLSNVLAKGGNEAESLQVKATVTFEVGGAGARISAVRLDVNGKVPGIDQQGFSDAVGQAKDGCPVSKALAGNVDISADATLG